MNQQTSDQEWQQLQSHIESFFGQALKNGIQRIEYRPQFVALLAMPFERHQAISENFSQKEDKYE
ncbi:MAG: hypothetical protein ACYDH8_08070 [Syntrophales bacterium]